MIIDVYSKYGCGIPLKNKSGLELSQALHHIMPKSKCKNYGWVLIKDSEMKLNSAITVAIQFSKVSFYHLIKIVIAKYTLEI